MAPLMDPLMDPIMEHKNLRQPSGYNFPWPRSFCFLTEHCSNFNFGKWNHVESTAWKKCLMNWAWATTSKGKPNNMDDILKSLPNGKASLFVSFFHFGVILVLLFVYFFYKCQKGHAICKPRQGLKTELFLLFNKISSFLSNLNLNFFFYVCMQWSLLGVICCG